MEDGPPTQSRGNRAGSRVEAGTQTKDPFESGYTSVESGM